MRCSKSEENDEAEENCEAEVQGHTSNPASLEVAAIADTDDDFEFNDSPVNEEKFINFEICNVFSALKTIAINVISFFSKIFTFSQTSPCYTLRGTL